jgi:hypothetical protein
MVVCYHVQMAQLVFVGAFIYDVLCGFFYFAALAYYIRIRERGSQPRPAQLLAFLALYICALNSKEMAVSLPVILLIYEILKCRPQAEWKGLIRWTRTSASTAILSGLLTAIYIYGKAQGSRSLIELDPYRPRYSWTTFMDSNSRFVSQFFYQFPTHIISHTGLLILWALVFLYAFIRRDRMLWLMAFWIVVVPLPIAFLIPFRGGATLYLLFFGWAMILATFASDIITLMSRSSILIGQGKGAATGAIIGGVATGHVRGTAIGAAAGVAASTMPASTFRIVASLMVAFSLAIFTQWENQRFGRPGALLNVGQKVSHVIQALRSLDLHPVPGSTILLKMKENPFPNKWHPLFIASLIWNDHSLRIWLEGVNRLTPQQLAKVDYIISFDEFQAKVIRAPEIRQTEQLPTDFKGFVAASLLHPQNDLCRPGLYFWNTKITVAVSGCSELLCLNRDLFSRNCPVVCAADSVLQAWRYYEPESESCGCNKGYRNGSDETFWRVRILKLRTNLSAVGDKGDSV